MADSNATSEHEAPHGLEKLVTGLDVNGGATVIAGLGAGLIFLAIELITGFVWGFDTPFGPADVLLIALTEQTVAGGFDFGLLFLATLFHLFTSIILAFILAFIIYRWSKGVAVLVGAVYGLVVYFVAFYLFSIVIGDIATARGVVMLANHILFGALIGWIYKALENK